MVMTKAIIKQIASFLALSIFCASLANASHDHHADQLPAACKVCKLDNQDNGNILNGVLVACHTIDCIAKNYAIVDITIGQTTNLHNKSPPQTLFFI